MRSANIVLFFVLSSFSGIAQTSVTIGTGTALLSDYQSGPIYRSSASSTYDFCQYAYLYTADELSALTPGAAISKIAWNKTNTAATVSDAKFKIYLKNSSTAAYTTAATFSTLTNGAMLVYNRYTAIPATTGFIDFTLDTTFIYTGGGLEVMVSWDIASVAGDPTTGAFNWQRTTADAKILGYVSATAITAALSPTFNSLGTITNTRPVLRITQSMPPPACSGAPASGFLTGPDSVCTGTYFSLATQGGTTGVTGLTYQWQYSQDSNTWVNVAGVTIDTLTVSQTTTTWYRRILRCGVNADTSAVKKVVVKQVSQCYCVPPSTNCSQDDVILNVSFGTLQHASGCSSNGYINYSDLVAAPSIFQRSAVPIAVSVGPGGTEYVAVWIDYNRNGSFDLNEYTAIGSGNGVVINGVINIPDSFPTGLTRMRVRVRYNTALSNTNACIGYNYGETEDYLVNILPYQECNSTPVAGSTVTRSNLLCAIDSALLTVNNATSDFLGLSYQWQSSKDSLLWEDLPGKTTASIYIMQDSTRFYRRSIACGTNTAFSIPVKVDMQVPNLCHCRPDSSNCTTYGNITLVNFAGIFNQSNCTPKGYTNYFTLADTARVQAATTVPITINSYARAVSITSFYYVWIDYDHSGTFDSSEFNFLGALKGGGTINSGIYIPVNALTGLTAMRVRVKFEIAPYSQGQGPCTSIPYAETEDYLVDVKAASSCFNNLTAGVISGPASVCAGISFSLNNINATDANIRYAWQSSPDSVNWVNINNTSSLLRSIQVSQNSTTYYRMVDSCSVTLNAVSNIFKVSMSANPIDCHCVPAGSSTCTGDDIITRVIFGSLDTSTYCSPNGYSDFVGTPATTSVNAYNAQAMSVRVGCSNTNPEWVAVWIDFNKNGIFERSEFTLLGSGCGSTISGTVDIPGNAAAGATRMRIRVTADRRFDPSDACTSFANGETEDYKISVNPYTTCPVFTWTGAVNNVWENPANWSCGIVPGRNANVVVNSGNLTISSNVTVYSLTVSPAATVTVLSPYTLVVTH